MDEIFHVYNRSIGEMEIFKNDSEYERFINGVRFYQAENPQIKFSDFLRQSSHLRGDMWYPLSHLGGGIHKEKLIDILAYCIMPTHFHLLIKQLKDAGIAIFVGNLLNSYTRCFNTKYGRKGTLWEGKSKKVLLESDEQLLHLTRYIHLNPVTAHLVDKPEEWRWSSYREYISETPKGTGICNYSSILDIKPAVYKKFVEDGIAYQRDMARAKKDNPTSEVG